MDDSVIEKTAKDYAAYLDVDIENKLKPIMQSVDEMLTRMEECGTMLSVIEKEREHTVETIKAIEAFSEGFAHLCSKIEATEKVVAHIKANVNALEARMEKAEQEFGITDNSVKVTNILLPIFKKSPEKTPSQYVELFRTEDYFSPNVE